MNGDKVLKLSTTHSDDDALNKAKMLIKDVIAGQEHVLFTDLDEPENDTEYTLEYSEALSNKILDEIKKPQYTNQLILTEVIVGVEDDGISTYEKATRTLAAPPGFDDTSADYDKILNELNSTSQAKPKKRRKKKKDPFNLGSKSDDIGDQISELSGYQEKQNNANSNAETNEPSEVSQSDQSTSDEENDKNENDLVHELVNSLVPSKDDITEKLNPNLDVDADDDTKSFGNTHASSLLAVYNIAKPHIRKIEKEDLDSQLEDFKREISNRPPSVINDLIEANDKRVQFANEVHDQTEHIRNEREKQRQEYIDAKLKEAEEQIRNQFEYEYPDNTEDKISEYLQSVKDDLDQYSADFDNKRSEAHSQLMEEFKKRQNDDSLNEVFDFLEQKATISGYAQDDIDNAYKRQGLYDLEEEDDDFDFDDDFATDESPNTNDNEQIEQNQHASDDDDGIVDIDKMMAQQANEYTDDHDESEPIISQDNSGTSQTQNDDESDFEDEDDPFGDAFEEDEPADENESLPEDNDIFDDDPILNEEVNEDIQDENDYPNPGDEFIEPQSEYQTDDEDEDDLLTEDVDEDKEIDNNIITASRADSTLSDDIENDKTQMADDYESTTLQDDGNDKADNKDKEKASKDSKKNKKQDENKTPSAIEILKLDKISKKTRKLIMIILASVIILAGIGAVTTSIIISNNDAHQEAQKKEEQKKELAKKKRLDEIAKYMKGKKMRVVDKESQNRVVFTVTDITEKGGAKGHYYKTDDGDRKKVEKYMSPEVVKDYVDRLKQQEKENEN